LGVNNPILSIHDVGAGGLSNAFPELVHDAGRGATLDLRAIPTADPSLSPMELWCNESQERYVLAIDSEKLADFQSLCERERAPYAVLGHSMDKSHLLVDDDPPAVDLPLDIVLGRAPRMVRQATTVAGPRNPVDFSGFTLLEVAERVLRYPAVASKGFLITIGDRTVTGLVTRDQMVGPWQVPVSDVACTAAGYDTLAGEAMATGERCPVALLDPAASARLAVTEALTNLAAATVGALSDVALSANWMAAAGAPGEDAALYAAVRAVGEGLCPALGVPIPVGKDSLSMRTVWPEGRVVAPVSLVVSAFAPVVDAGAAWTPQLRGGPRVLVAVDLSDGKNRLGGSVAARVVGSLGDVAPDLDDPARLSCFFAVTRELHRAGTVSAYHDRSDGGWFVCALEMAFAAHLGIDLDFGAFGDEPFSVLFAEEPGALFEVDETEADALVARFRALRLRAAVVGRATSTRMATFRLGQTVVLYGDAVRWHHRWAETSARMQALRDEPGCAAEEHAAILDVDDPGLSPVLTFDPHDDVAGPYILTGVRPPIAILREQGVNGQTEMAAAFDRAGFAAFDVHMSDLIAGRADLASFVGLVACGGFSYGDVLGAGGGWAATILYQDRLREAFAAFFARPDTFGLGICNGCQMMARLAPLIPGAQDWPLFVRNRSEQFEARICTLDVAPSPSILLAGMEGSRLPVAVAHGEGRADWGERSPSGQIVARYVDNTGRATQRYPFNPNGSPDAVAGLTTEDGRVTILMPHPERVFRAVAHTWRPDTWHGDGPWMRLFRNARKAVG
jgi:phosphoribosylformylglycinamidine synthase